MNARVHEAQETKIFTEQAASGRHKVSIFSWRRHRHHRAVNAIDCIRCHTSPPVMLRRATDFPNVAGAPHGPVCHQPFQSPRQTSTRGPCA